MNHSGKSNVAPDKDRDQTKVGVGFFYTLAEHPVFKREKSAINEAHYWLSEIAAAMTANYGNPVTCGYKKIQDRFRKCAQSHVEFLGALSELQLINVTQRRRSTKESGDGQPRQFALTPRAWFLLAQGNSRWLHLLITDAKTRRRNQVAIARRKMRRTVCSDPTMRAIDEFRYGLKFERAGLLKQLRLDSSRAGVRHAFVVHLLLAFETRTFCDLILKEGQIYHEFVSLPWNYRRYAAFKGKRYVTFLNVKECPLPCELYPPMHAYGGSLGLVLIYENDGAGVFAEKDDTELPAKLEKVRAFIQRQFHERRQNPS